MAAGLVAGALGVVALAASGDPLHAAASTGPVLAGDWSADERQAIASAIERLPQAVRQRSSGRVWRDGRRCDRDGLPPDADLVDAGGRIHLCAARPGESPAAVARVVVLGILFAFDRSAGWSDDPSWRRLNGWRPSLASGLRPRPANVSPAGFASPRGQLSPRWDLVTFMVASWLDGAPANIGCRLLSHASYVARRLKALGPRSSGAPPAAPARCPAFEEWAALDHLADVEVVLAAPSTAMIGSLFGHVFLRLVYRDPNGEMPPHLSRTVAFLADNDAPFSEDRAYALKGIAGYYTASLHERAFLDAYREYVVLEGRDLRRWRLDLDTGERRALLERIWTVVHSGRYTYYFFRRNCATLMVDLLNDVRPVESEVSTVGMIAAPPASILEPWERARGASGGPLLQFIPERTSSFDHQARTMSRHRRDTAVRIAAGAPDGVRAEVDAAFRDAHAPEPPVRAAAYERLGRLLADRRIGDRDDVRAWLRDSAAIESHLSIAANVRAEAEAEQSRRRRVRQVADEAAANLRRMTEGWRAPEAAAAVVRRTRVATAIERLDSSNPTARLDGYKELAALTRELNAQPGAEAAVAEIRLLALLRSEQRYDVVRMRNVPELRQTLLFPAAEKPIEDQLYLAGRAALITASVATDVSVPLRSLQRAKQVLFAARDLGATGGGGIDGAQAATALRRDYDEALPSSGLDRLEVGAGAAASAATGLATAPGLMLRGALFDERLGEHRRFGFPSSTGFTVARSATLLTIEDGRPVVLTYDARLFGYRSLRLPLPESGSGRATLGWELFADLAGSRARALASQARIGWGLLAPVAERADLRDHILVGLALAYEVGFPAERAVVKGIPHAVGLPVSVELRAGMGAAPRYRSWLAATAWVEPKLIFAGFPTQLAFASGAALEARLQLRGRDDARLGAALLIRAQILHTTLAFDGSRAATEGIASVGFPIR